MEIKQVKIVNDHSAENLEGKINRAIFELIESHKVSDPDDIKVQITMNHNLILGLIMYNTNIDIKNLPYHVN